MACKTCSHTMAILGLSNGCTLYLCPRCGTVKRAAGPAADEEWYVPKLVERCRLFERSIVAFESAAALEEEWKRLGIEESINVPENRNL